MDPAERAVIWVGRKSAFAAVGRICAAYIVQDGVVPRSALGPVLDEIAKLSAESGIRVANVFHAGDGNLHPLVLYDDSSPEATEARRGAVRRDPGPVHQHGGSITGEHGVGVDKSRYMPKMFGADDLDTMQLLRCAFDPGRPVQPGQGVPDPAAVRRGARGAPRRRTRWSPPARRSNSDA